MSMQVNFSPELRAWLMHNLDRGCVPVHLVDSMVAQQFDPKVAHGLVHAFMEARLLGREPPSGSVVLDTEEADYRYESPRLAPGPLIKTFDRDIPVLARLEQPVLAVMAEVLSADECAQVIDLARSRLRPSTVVDPVTGRDKVADHRNSQGMFFALQELPLIARLDQRISELMNMPLEHGEGLQVLNYQPGAESTPHYDFLSPSNQPNRDSLARSGQRVSSLVVYLNDVPAGGETWFPEAGLSVLPRRGHAVYFEYANSLGQVDLKSVHAGAAVQAGDKWVMTKWMRERRFVPQGLSGTPAG